MKLRPLQDRIVVQVEAKADRTEAGIYIPKTAMPDAFLRGMVVAVGPGKRTDAGALEPVQVTEGDTVVFSSRLANPVDGKPDGLIVLRQDDVLAVVEEE